MGELRIVAGRWGGRRIRTRHGQATRPTAEKVRAALFNALDAWLELEGARGVDLFAGSGALGLEALSRGAAQVTFVESEARTAAGIRTNLADLGVPAEAAQVVTRPALAWLSHTPSAEVNLVLLDPPYESGAYGPVLEALSRWPGLAPGAIIAVEAPARLDVPIPAALEAVRVKRYGDTQLLFLRKAAPATAQDGAP
jgi:16S rRNA (guanine966-N2)-methyltransferase